MTADACGIEIFVTGYGMKCVEGGSPIFLEVFEGRLVLRVWADINKEDPTHVIDLAEAREDARKDDTP